METATVRITRPATWRRALRLRRPSAVLIVLSLLVGVLTFLAPFDRGSAAPALPAAGVQTRIAPMAPAHGASGGPVSDDLPPKPKSIARLAAPPTPAPPHTTSITLRRGDTLWALSSQYHTTVATLQQINGLGSSTLIYAGRQLRVPADATGPGSDRPSPSVGSTGPGERPSASTDTTTSTPTSGAAAVVAYAEAQLGKPYRWGEAGPDGFDCSGLVMRAWQAAGVQLPRVTYDQARAGTRTTRAALKPGDLVFTENFGHVELYIGDGRVIYAPRPGAFVTTDLLPPAASVDAYVHVSP